MGINEEEILSISIGPHQWYRLEAELDPGEAESFSKFFYDPSTSQLSGEDALILEVVLAGTYDHLVKSARLWLREDRMYKEYSLWNLQTVPNTIVPLRMLQLRID
ncbi:hypothetical protein CIHG_07517 [Coccidioides immitis H538.4]|uniref:Uncharacterized protein n=2 Tax=Coccidioides immitis TaxID=5501 RepID=A0A0J8RX30_COCIT|nr:hypothetical protein CIRG_02350 [Coccidioides immitis RMSCC 2394]KMU89710.1 hypothetical protein CIHG_07517 [Coccidioides immitis H538.4]